MFTLDGDLCQMSAMERRLRNAGHPVTLTGVYPAFTNEEDFIKALQYLWDYLVEGWWNQSDDMIKHGICTKEEYKNTLDEYCARPPHLR